MGSRHYYNGLFKDENYEKNCKTVQKRGPKTVVFTLGAKGVVGLDGDKYFEIPAFKNLNSRYHRRRGRVSRRFYFRFITGMGRRKNTEFSSAVSVIKCTRLGGRAAIPDYKTVQNFMQTGKIDYTEIDKRVAFYREGMINSVLANCK